MRALKRVKNWEAVGRRARYDCRAVADVFEITPRTLQRFFLSEYAITPQRWLNELRLRDAKMLAKRGLSGEQITRKLGFKQLSHLSREFRRYHGRTLTECR